MQPQARCLLLVLFVCIVNLSNIVGVPPPASAGRRCLSKADAKVRTFSRTRKLFRDFFQKKDVFHAFFDFRQAQGGGTHIFIYICGEKGKGKPRSRAAGNWTGKEGKMEDGREKEREKGVGMKKSRDVSQHTALSLSRPIKAVGLLDSVIFTNVLPSSGRTHHLDVYKTTKTIKIIYLLILLSDVFASPRLYQP